MADWLREHAGALAGASIGISVVLLLVGVAIVVKLPANHFVGRDRSKESATRHPVLRPLFLVTKNVVGVALMLLGILMALPLVPGPGIVLIVVGLSLTNFPGKHRLETWLLERPWVLKPLNRLRKAFGKPPIQTAVT
jgi:hypothetical protein